MKLILYIILTVCFSLYACGNRSTERKVVEVRQDDKFEQPTGNANKREQLWEPDSVYYTELKPDSATYYLKKGYKLSLYPSDGNQTYNAKLKGCGMDSVILQSGTGFEKYILHYDSVDFDDFFIVTSYRTHFLFRKNTGKMVRELTWHSSNIDHNLLLCNGTTLLNLKNGKEVEIDLYMPRTVPEMIAVNAYISYHISDVTDKEIIIVYDGVEPIIEIRVPRSKLK